MSKYVYAFSGDPITPGHKNVIRRIKKTHPKDELVVAIGANPDKKYLFTLDEREAMARKYLSDLDVEVVSFEGMLTDYAIENGFDVVYRGIRDADDARDELNLFYALRTQNTDLEMHLIPAHEEMTHISSSNVKAIAKEHGRIHELVSIPVKEAIDAKMLGQYPVSITGVSGAGKSYISKELKSIADEFGIPVHYMNLDALGHQILGESTEDLYVKTRKKITDAFGDGVALPDGFIDRKALGDVVFGKPSEMAKLDKIMYQPMMIKITREKYGDDKKGLLLIDGALTAEFGWAHLSNNNVVLVTADEKTIESRLGNLGLDFDQIQRRKESQYTEERKRSEMLKRISEDGNGKLWEINNSDGSNPDLQSYLTDTILTLDRWGELRFKGLWNRIGADGTPDAEYKKLVDAYTEPHRHYHTLGGHIIDGLDELWRIRHLLEKPDEVEFAWWLHDYVYKKQSKVNEKRSAQAANNICANAMLEKEFADDVSALVLDTGHNDVPKTSDGKFIADLDLLIFGKPPEVFDECERRIRKEYSWADPEEFKSGRAAVLQRFVKRPRIYYTDIFHEMYEKQARQNLKRSLSTLEAI
ncbi:MAG: dephospho-CoA kinase [Candidatus Aenigmarchaeota archaeon]|nr:dephospho-CoA kinase [Candidatus Aenigmarchaeota archaeon]